MANHTQGDYGWKKAVASRLDKAIASHVTVASNEIRNKEAESKSRLAAAAPDLLAALERLLEECNPFMTDTESCECGENGNGRDDDGNVCEHIQAKRAIAKAKDVK